MTKRYKSDIHRAVHRMMQDASDVGVVDKTTMRQFDESCLTMPQPLNPREIKAIRVRAGVSQAVFARALNVTTDYVSKIERGAKRPSGSTLKLLSLMRRKGFEAIL